MKKKIVLIPLSPVSVCVFMLVCVHVLLHFYFILMSFQTPILYIEWGCVCSCTQWSCTISSIMLPPYIFKAWVFPSEKIYIHFILTNLLTTLDKIIKTIGQQFVLMFVLRLSKINSFSNLSSLFHTQSIKSTLISFKFNVLKSRRLNFLM